MKIVMLISSFYPLVGGAERQAQRLAEKLVESGNEVTVLTRWHSGLSFNEDLNGIKVKRLRVSRCGRLAPILYLIKVLQYVNRNKNHIDAVHAHALSAPGISAAFVSKIYKIPSIAKIAGGGGKNGCEIIRMKNSGKLGELKVRFLKKNINLFIAISKSIEKDLIKSGVDEEKIYFLPNGIDLNVFYPSVHKQQKKPNTFVYIGRLEKIKGIDILIRAWKDLSPEFKKNNKLVIAGEGKEINVLSNIKNENIHYIGKQKDILTLLNNSDVFLLPSRYEGISNALLEAMATEKIIIASNVGGNVDLIAPNYNGLLFESEEINDLKNCILYVSKNIMKLNRLKKNARETLKGKYDIDRNVKEYIQIYSDISRRRGYK